MNEIQRYNLQRGVKEDRRFEATTYISDGSMLDNYLLEKQRIKEKMLTEEELYKRIEEIAAKEIQRCFNDLFKDFK
jgi:hypothetical protein